jgi:hypothetical protein
MTAIARTVALAILVLAAPAAAAPPDCSQGPIVDKPVGGGVRGKPFVPKETVLSVTRNGMAVNGTAFDSYTLAIRTDGIFNELTVTMLVPAGKKPDGRSFRVLPVDSIGAQPAAMKGVPEVQGWELELEAAGVDTSFTQEIASIRVEFGARKGGTLPGKIHFCVPGQETEIEGGFAAALP